MAVSEITIRRAREIALKVSQDKGDSKTAKRAAGRVMSGPTTTVRPPSDLVRAAVDKVLKGPGPSRAECRAAALAMGQMPKY